MRLDFDEAKRAETIKARGLDMVRAADVLAGATLTVEDDRQDYGELRFITIGFLDDTMVVLVWDATRRCMPDHKHEEGQ